MTDGDLVKTIRLAVLEPWILKPVSPVCPESTADAAENPVGGVQAVPTKGLFSQYSNSIEPTEEELGILN